MEPGFIAADSPASPNPDETAEARRLRLAREAVLLAEGRAELDAGLGLPLEAVEAWLDDPGQAAVPVSLGVVPPRA